VRGEKYFGVALRPALGVMRLNNKWQESKQGNLLTCAAVPPVHGKKNGCEPTST